MAENQAEACQAPSPVEELAQRAHAHMQDLDYGYRTVDRYRCLWKKLADFAGKQEFSRELVDRFMAEIAEPPVCVSILQKRRSALNWLVRYHSQGFVRYHQAKDLVVLSDHFEARVGEYEAQFTRLHGGSKQGMQKRVSAARRFLAFLAAHGCCCLGELQPQHVTEFLHSLSHLRPRSLAQVAIDLKPFLRYAWMAGHIAQDLSTSLPRIWNSQDTHIPTVFSAEEISNILSAVDRSSPKGKRDFAMLLLACRLGLRAGDIRTLTLDNLNWEKSQIAIVQSKTGMPLTLPLTNEVGEAIIDYLKSGRPKTRHREVFIRVCAPFSPLGSSSALSQIVSLYLHRAAVAIPREGHAGMHSLRHSIATRLLEGGVSLKTISDILGHASMESTRIYTKVDIRALSSVPLDPDDLEGKGATLCLRK
jgi:site-specific recombinase XerD